MLSDDVSCTTGGESVSSCRPVVQLTPAHAGKEVRFSRYREAHLLSGVSRRQLHDRTAGAHALPAGRATDVVGQHDVVDAYQYVYNLGTTGAWRRAVRDSDHHQR